MPRVYHRLGLRFKIGHHLTATFPAPAHTTGGGGWDVGMVLFKFLPALQPLDLLGPKLGWVGLPEYWWGVAHVGRWRALACMHGLVWEVPDGNSIPGTKRRGKLLRRVECALS
ncbi:uncharacterized protein BO96DRAFT_323132 [Aspergillus niger CBS 101883]|uniref:Uncharacterized protein n=2 Tax=Aspergillus niger TaxID=5061 RepID=A2QE54_ASPNC|nr:uncharacterized protein BO96DRAFT_323132 [Aspergillus niger CBS 101883]XP_059603453.1 hypothetical protein An02g09450 [Aspergillus niger]PYH61745.1 hypothetical protein BO96DRAFT_323132 [Aspergillus niger CBS 101883]CAK44346.1 hypothetical protein An02g09450 [Aspergillus niger]